MRIAVIGPHNTGKATFIEDFVASFPDYVTPGETYRDVIIAQDLAINEETTEENQRLIRDFLFDQVSSNIEENVIFDRSVIDNYVYTKVQAERGAIDEGFASETAEVMYESLEYLDAVIFIPTALSAPLIADELRDTDTTFIDSVNRLFFDTLLAIARESALPIITITGDREERIIAAERRLFAAPSYS